MKHPHIRFFLGDVIGDVADDITASPENWKWSCDPTTKFSWEDPMGVIALIIVTAAFSVIGWFGFCCLLGLLGYYQ